MKPTRDPVYLAWIRTFPCCVPACNVRRSEAHHAGVRGLGQKADDRTAIPLCAHHHRTGRDSAHVRGKRFWNYHGIDRGNLIAGLNHEFEQSNERKESSQGTPGLE